MHGFWRQLGDGERPEARQRHLSNCTSDPAGDSQVLLISCSPLGLKYGQATVLELEFAMVIAVDVVSVLPVRRRHGHIHICVPLQTTRFGRKMFQNSTVASFHAVAVERSSLSRSKICGE